MKVVRRKMYLLIDEGHSDDGGQSLFLHLDLMHFGSVATSISVSVSEYYKTKLNKWYHRRPYTRLSVESLSSLTFGEGLSVLSKMISEGPSSILPLPDLDIGWDLVDSE